MGKGDGRYAPLAGAVFVVLTIVAFVVLGGNTPDGDASARKVVTYYNDHEGRQIAASIVLSIGAVFLIAFSATLRVALRRVEGGAGRLSSIAFAGGLVSAVGFLTGAGIHFALADYAGDINPVASQAVNSIDSDFFIPFTVGLAVLLLATSVVTLRVSGPLPRWMAWVGLVIFIAFFTPAGFFAFGLSGIWIIVVSVLLYTRGYSDSEVAGAAG